MNGQNTVFRFVKYEFLKEEGKACFSYQLITPSKTYDFKEELIFPTTGIDWENVSEDLLKKSLENLLLIMGVSYWKLLCPTKIETPTIKLSKEQAIFWETVYTKGLGEFFYKNQIDFLGLVKFPYVEDIEKSSDQTIDSPMGIQDKNSTMQQFNNRSLLFFGGGKDSIVSAELLKKNNKNFVTMVINPKELHRQTLKVLGNGSLFFERKIDPQLLELSHQNEFYNGHIPFTAVNSFIGVFTAILYNFKNIISSNEKSANFGNVEYLGHEVNHQWSKSFEFENLFSNYVKAFISKDIVYFSILREYSELKITEIFSNYSQYFSFFASCNKNFKFKDPMQNNLWCGHCPKCLFVFILLSAFLSKETVINIFGKNLFEDQSLLPLLNELLGIGKIKPFECVGTPRETLLAMFLCEQKGEFKNDFLMDYFVKEVMQTIKNPENLEEEFLVKNGENLIPKEFEKII